MAALRRHPKHFLDGNDPARVPGAAVSYPKVNPNLQYDADAGTLLDPETGYGFSLKITDREYHSFSAIINQFGQPIAELQGFFGTYEKPGFGSTTGFSLTHIEPVDETTSPAQVDALATLAGVFLNLYPPTLGKPEFAGNVVLISNIPAEAGGDR